MLVCAVVVLAGCSTARMEESSAALGGSGPRWGVVSYRKARDQEDVRKMMTDYCAPDGYKIVNTDQRAAGIVGGSQTNAYGGTIGSSRIVNRTYIRFECEEAKVPPSPEVK